MRAGEDALFEHAPCGYLVCDPTGLILQANAELLSMVGLTHEAVVGTRTLASLVSVGARIYLQTHIFPMLRMQDAVSEVALDILGPGRERIPVLLNANVRRSSGGEPEIIRAVVFPARDRRRYEADLLEAVHAAEEARRRADELAHTLQQSLIPPKPPDISGLEVATAYRPAGDGTEVGGDFFDVFQVSADEWVIVLGDVMGKGVEAATVTAFVRHAVRALAVQVSDPAQLLHQLNTDLAAHPSQRFCTVVLVRLSRADGTWTLTGTVGGNPLPLLRHGSGEVTPLGEPGSLVGLDEVATYTTFRHQLCDELLVLFTDGVTEARRGREQYAEDRLAALITATGPDVHRQAETIVETVLTYQHGVAADDIAVVALRATPAS